MITVNSNSLADVTSAVNAAERNETIQLLAGSITWASNLTLPQGVHLKGPGRDLLTITGPTGGSFILIQPDNTAILNEETIRVTGVTLDGANASYIGIQIAGPGATSSKPFKNLALGELRIKNISTTSGGPTTSAIYSNGQVRGVIYDTIFDRCPRTMYAGGSNSVVEFNNGNFPYAFGTVDNLFFEDNTVTFSSAYDTNAPGYQESGQGGRIVERYSNFNYANSTSGGTATSVEWCDVHGFQNWTPSSGDNGQTGTMVAEYYGNTITNYSGNHLITMRGGWGLFHNNIVTTAVGHGPAYIVAWDTDNSTAAYVDGLNGGIDTRVHNTYCWNNSVDGTEVAMLGNYPTGVRGTPTTDENGQYFNFTPSCLTCVDGGPSPTGITRGSATPSLLSTNGFAYWKNATPAPSVNPAVVQSGSLIVRVSGSNVNYYTPFTYPHPLRATSGSANIYIR